MECWSKKSFFQILRHTWKSGMKVLEVTVPRIFWNTKKWCDEAKETYSQILRYTRKSGWKYKKKCTRILGIPEKMVCWSKNFFPNLKLYQTENQAWKYKIMYAGFFWYNSKYGMIKLKKLLHQILRYTRNFIAVQKNVPQILRYTGKTGMIKWKKLLPKF
jgi:hypothetical protein